MQDGSDPKKPGQVIQPGGSIQPTDPQPNQPPVSAPVQGSGWQFTQEDAAVTSVAQPSVGEVSWTASEFIAHEKDTNWYAKLVGITVVVTVAVFLLTQDKISTGMVVVVGVLFGIVAARQPRTLPYTVDSKGVSIGQKFYSYGLFRSFAVVQEGAFSSIVLMPLKRFMPSISIYYPPEEEQRIIGVLGSYLPHEERKLDPLDNFMRKVRF